jgi:hypothetical protein
MTATQISHTDAYEKIKLNNLYLYVNVWHYTFNLELYNSCKAFLHKRKLKVTVVFEAYNTHSPALVFTNTDNNTCTCSNYLTQGFDRDKEYTKLFWHLKLSNFEDFLQRKTAVSKHPGKHYPSKITYPVFEKALKPVLSISPLNIAYFINLFDLLRPTHFLSGQEVIETFNRENSTVPTNWLKMGVLTCNDEIVAVSLLVDDSKALSLINITAKRDKWSYGVVLCTKIIEHACLYNYLSFDAGISSVYGSYKKKIFLDSMEISLNNKLSFSGKLIRFIKNIFNA